MRTNSASGLKLIDLFCFQEEDDANDINVSSFANLFDRPITTSVSRLVQYYESLIPWINQHIQHTDVLVDPVKIFQ